MSEILVYTAIFGGRDEIKVPKQDGFDFRVVTDDATQIDREIAVVTSLPVASDPRRSARLVKLMPQVFFPAYRRWIWIDGQVSLREGVSGKDLESIRGPLATFRHRNRNCAYQEALACTKSKLDDEEVIRRQVEGYHEEGFPQNKGLGETMVVVRDNTPEIRAFNSAWWAEVNGKSVRDQISFNYVAWKLKVQIEYMGRCTGTQWFRMGPHNS